MGTAFASWTSLPRRSFRFGSQRVTLGMDLYNVLNNNVTLAFNQTFVPNTAGVAVADHVHEPARDPAERRVRLVG